MTTTETSTDVDGTTTTNYTTKRTCNLTEESLTRGPNPFVQNLAPDTPILLSPVCEQTSTFSIVSTKTLRSVFSPADPPRARTFLARGERYH
jgi:hypothetical protein